MKQFLALFIYVHQLRFGIDELHKSMKENNKKTTGSFKSDK